MEGKILIKKQVKSEIVLAAEIKARYERAIEEQHDELDFYMELLENGITVDMVRKYMDDEHASAMNLFCKEHGLI